MEFLVLKIFQIEQHDLNSYTANIHALGGKYLKTCKVQNVEELKQLYPNHEIQGWEDSNKENKENKGNKVMDLTLVPKNWIKYAKPYCSIDVQSCIRYLEFYKDYVIFQCRWHKTPQIRVYDLNLEFKTSLNCDPMRNMIIYNHKIYYYISRILYCFDILTSQKTKIQVLQGYIRRIIRNENQLWIWTFGGRYVFDLKTNQLYFSTQIPQQPYEIYGSYLLFKPDSPIIIIYKKPDLQKPVMELSVNAHTWFINNGYCFIQKYQSGKMILEVYDIKTQTKVFSSLNGVHMSFYQNVNNTNYVFDNETIFEMDFSTKTVQKVHSFKDFDRIRCIKSHPDKKILIIRHQRGISLLR